MRKYLLALLIIVLPSFVHAREISGEPVFKFFNFIGCVEKNPHLPKHLNDAEKKLVEGIREAHAELIELGLEGYCHLPIIDSEKVTRETFVPKRVYEKLWSINPHALVRQNKKYIMHGNFDEFLWGDKTAYKANSVKLKTVTGQPMLRK